MIQERYNVTGMTCAACSARIQKSVARLDGVQGCIVNLLKTVWSSITTALPRHSVFISAVEKSGYGASLQNVAKQRKAPSHRWRLLKKTMKR